ncbi:Large exoprotein involved in heme utilization or adhesion [Planoprotostelium fungivorum]|uniref:Large exoprotein involved in heme utilization or adhesion n=1 Tax=Planoprotostelium fungivorum TaxID=1890364 RepID=A0A2P6N4U1_9EUKA|nr:Large exoprotein involved in heme utilization or adhesion [Planoprotostelium fungivorum]
MKSALRVFFTVLFFLDVDAVTVDWAHLTSDQLHTISPNVFRNITNGELSSIPTTSFTGFTADQIENIPFWLMAYISPAEINQIPPSSFSGFTEQQLGKFRGHCSNLTVEQFRVLNSAQLSALPGFFCLSKLTQDVIRSITREQLPPLDVKGKEEEDLKGGVDGTGFSKEQISNLSGDAVSAFNSTQFSQLTESCAGFAPSQISRLDESALSGMNGECARVISGAVWGSLSASQASNLSLVAVAALTNNSALNDNILSIPFSYFTPSQISSLSARSCGCLNESMIRSIGNTTLFSPHCLGNMTTDVWVSFSPDQLSEIIDCSNVRAIQISRVESKHFHAVTGECLKSLLRNVLFSLSPAQIERISPSTCVSLDKETVTSMPDEWIEILSEEQIKMLGGIAGFTVHQLQLLTSRLPNFPSFFDSRTLDTPPSVILPFKNLLWREITPDQRLPSLPVPLSWLHVVTLMGEESKSINGSWIHIWDEFAVRGLRRDQITHMNDETFASFSNSQAQNLMEDTLFALSPSQVSHFTVDAFASLNLVSLRNTSFSGITKEQVKKIQLRFFKLFSCGQLLYLSEETVSALSRNNADEWARRMNTTQCKQAKLRMPFDSTSSSSSSSSSSSESGTQRTNTSPPETQPVSTDDGDASQKIVIIALSVVFLLIVAIIATILLRGYYNRKEQQRGFVSLSQEVDVEEETLDELSKRKKRNKRNRKYSR